VYPSLIDSPRLKKEQGPAIEVPGDIPQLVKGQSLLALDELLPRGRGDADLRRQHIKVNTPIVTAPSDAVQVYVLDSGHVGIRL
jgi:hypothetical protein